jgi:hypothetical protein
MATITIRLRCHQCGCDPRKYAVSGSGIIKRKTRTKIIIRYCNMNIGNHSDKP